MGYDVRDGYIKSYGCNTIVDCIYPRFLLKSVQATSADQLRQASIIVDEAYIFSVYISNNDNISK